MNGSILTNRASMTALDTLRSLSEQMEDTQKHISTGLRINEASDNIAYWSVANGMRNDASLLSTVGDALNVGKGKVNAADTSTKQVAQELTAIKKDMAQIESNNGNVEDIKKIQGDIKARITNIKNAISAAYINGENILTNDGGATGAGGAGSNFTFIAGFRRGKTGIETDTINLSKADVQLAGVDTNGAADWTKGKLKDLLGVDFGADIIKSNKVDNTAINKDMKTLDDAIHAVENTQVALGSVKKQIDSQVEFTIKLSDNLTKAIGSLVDTDMDAESAKLSALKVQQQLAVQALSLANQSTQHILALYRN